MSIVTVIEAHSDFVAGGERWNCFLAAAEPPFGTYWAASPVATDNFLKTTAIQHMRRTGDGNKARVHNHWLSSTCCGDAWRALGVLHG